METAAEPKQMIPATLEAGSLAHEMAIAHRKMVEFYRDHFNVSGSEALAETEKPPHPEHLKRVLHGEPDQVSWLDFHALCVRDPQLAAQRYGEIRRAASAELRSGHRAAKAMESTTSGPWQRAQFLAVRENLASDWQPRNGIEWTLIDTMAQAFTAQLFWQERLTLYSTGEYENDNQKTNERGSWNSPRVSDAEAVDRAAGMVDRFHRMFVRAVRALRDLRRYTPVVIVQNAAQVNVGEQQVNVAMEKERALPEAQAP